MTGATPEGRRSGDVGGAGLLTNLQPNFRTRPQKTRRSFDTHPSNKNPPKGRIKRVHVPPFAKRKGDAASAARRRGMPGAYGRGPSQPIIQITKITVQNNTHP